MRNLLEVLKYVYESGLIFGIIAVMAMIVEWNLIVQAVRECREHNEMAEEELTEAERAEILAEQEKAAVRQRKLFIFAVRQNLLPELYEYRLWKQRQERKSELTGFLKSTSRSQKDVF